MTNKELFKQAVREGVNLRINQDAACAENIICSDGYYRKLSEIFGFEVTRPNPKRTVLKRAVAAALIAAALLLAGCAAVVYKEQIGDFFVNTYETYIKGYFVSNDEESHTAIEDFYTLTYVPDGYEVFENNESSVLVQYKWKNSYGDMIVFGQATLHTTRYTLDSENGSSFTVEYGGLTLYCQTIDKYNYFVWCDDKYSYSLKISAEIETEELYLIIDGITKNNCN